MPQFIFGTIIFGIWGTTLAIASLPFLFSNPTNKLQVLGSILLFPILFITIYPNLCGLISKLGQKTIIKGKFPRDLKNPIYFGRRLYGLCWTMIYYFTPLYFTVLTVTPFKRFIFKLFGYKGHLNFTIYPDTWTRDIPLLNFGDGTYIANRSTLGTNMCMQDGTILVGPIVIGDKSSLGHLAMLSLGAKVGTDVEIGAGVAIGARVTLGSKTKISSISGLNHGCRVRENCSVGAHSYIGVHATVGPGLSLPPCSNIPDGAILKTQTDVKKYYSSEARSLREKTSELSELARKYATDNH